MLDPPDALRRADPGGMLGALQHFPEQLRDAIRIGNAYRPRASQPVDRVLACGMGGSGIAGALLAEWLSASSTRVPVILHRDYGLPGFADVRTLVVALSYSGDTEEVLDSFRRAKAAGCALLAVTTGGALAARAREYGADTLQLPPGLQPRAALGYLSLPLAIALERWGIADGARKASEGVLRGVEPLAKACAPDVPEARNEAKRLARSLHGRVPVAYGLGPYAVAARRLANELSENAKVPAFWGGIPEVCHNDLVGLDGGDSSGLALAILSGPEAGEGNEARGRFVARAAEAHGARVAWVRASGQDLLANLFHAIHLGDWGSVYLALLRGVDPTPVDVIGRLKEELRQHGR